MSRKALKNTNKSVLMAPGHPTILLKSNWFNMAAVSVKKGLLFWMNNKTIIEFGFRITWRIIETSEGVIRLGLRLRRITPSKTSIILHKMLSLITFDEGERLLFVYRTQSSNCSVCHAISRFGRHLGPAWHTLPRSYVFSFSHPGAGIYFVTLLHR